MHSFEYTFLSWHNFSITKEIKENSNLGTINLLTNAKTIFLITIIDIFIHINIRTKKIVSNVCKTKLYFVDIYNIC